MNKIVLTEQQRKNWDNLFLLLKKKKQCRGSIATIDGSYCIHGLLFAATGSKAEKEDHPYRLDFPDCINGISMLRSQVVDRYGVSIDWEAVRITGESLMYLNDREGKDFSFFSNLFKEILKEKTDYYPNFCPTGGDCRPTAFSAYNKRDGK